MKRQKSIQVLVLQRSPSLVLERKTDRERERERERREREREERERECVCVWRKARERERDRAQERERETCFIAQQSLSIALRAQGRYLREGLGAHRLTRNALHARSGFYRHIHLHKHVPPLLLPRASFA